MPFIRLHLLPPSSGEEGGHVVVSVRSPLERGLWCMQNASMTTLWVRGSKSSCLEMKVTVRQPKVRNCDHPVNRLQCIAVQRAKVVEGNKLPHQGEDKRYKLTPVVIN